MKKKELPEKIYLATFGKPRYIMEIGEILYGKKQMTYPKLMGKKGAIQECLDKGLIEDVTDSIISTNKDGFHRRKYYRAKIDPIMKKINTHIHTILKATTFNEKEIEPIIEKILDSNAFRYWIEKNYPENNSLFSLNAIEFILSFLDILFILFNSNKTINQSFNDVKNIKRYNSIINQLRKDDNFKNKLSELAYIFFGEKNPSKEIMKDLPYLFIMPDIPLIEICGFSQFGNLYYTSKFLSKDVSNLFSDLVFH